MLLQYCETYMWNKLIENNNSIVYLPFLKLKSPENYILLLSLKWYKGPKYCVNSVLTLR